MKDDNAFENYNLKIFELLRDIDKRFNDLTKWQAQIEINQATYVKRSDIEELINAVRDLKKHEPDNMKFSTIAISILREIGRIGIAIITAYEIMRMGIK